MSDDVMQLAEEYAQATRRAHASIHQMDYDAKDAARAALVAALQQGDRRFDAAPDADLLLLRDVLFNDLGTADPDKVREWTTKARAALAACQQALQRYGQHDTTCRAHPDWGYDSPQPCNCGFAAASRPAGGAPDDAKRETTSTEDM